MPNLKELIENGELLYQITAAKFKYYLDWGGALIWMEVYELTEGSIIELDRLVGEPLDLVVNGQIIAQGEVVAIDNNYGFRITNIVSSN